MHSDYLAYPTLDDPALTIVPSQLYHLPNESDQYPANTNSEIWMALYLPLLPFAASTDTTTKLATIVYEKNQQQYQVIAVNQEAGQANIKIGMPLSTARTLVPQVRVLERDLQAERSAMEKLAIRTTAWSPKVVISHDRVLLLEVGSCMRLHHGLPALIASMHEELQGKPYQYLTAVTPTPASAILCARTSHEICVTDRAQLVSSISNLPTHKLQLNRRQKILLQQLGIEHIGELLRLPRSGIARRLGPKLLENLDRLLGRRADPQLIFQPPLCFKNNIELEQEISEVERLLPRVALLLAQLEQYLRRSCAVISHLEWYLGHEEQTPTRIPIRLSRPQRGAALLLEMSRLSFEAIHPSCAITRITLHANPLPSLQPQNTSLLSCAKQNSSGELLDRLYSRLGHQAVRGICCSPNNRPEKAWKSCCPGTNESIFQFASRPLWLLPSPLPLSNHNGQPYFHGPLELTKHERIVSNWWDDVSIQRDYYQAKASQGFIWIFRELETRNWYLHGIF